jgi:hypothetical protein
MLERKNHTQNFPISLVFGPRSLGGVLVIGNISDRSRSHRNGCVGKDHDWLTFLRAELNRAIISKYRRSGKL